MLLIHNNNTNITRNITKNYQWLTQVEKERKLDGPSSVRNGDFIVLVPLSFWDFFEEIEKDEVKATLNTIQINNK